MKIAILTLVFNNYGTRLQSYALCKVLKRLGGEDASIKVVNMDTPWGSGARSSFVERFRKLAASFKGYGVHGFKHVAELFRWRMNIGGSTGKNMKGYAGCETSLLV